MGGEQRAKEWARTLLGEVLAGRYRIDRLIDLGGMGAVFEGRQLELDRPVAVKILLPPSVDAGPVEADAAGRLRREARLAASVGGSGVVQVFDFGMHEGAPFVAMELLKGETLAQRLRRGALSVAEAAALAKALLSTLVRLHRAGLVHRDLKPANIFLANEEQQMVPKLLDFGLSDAPDVEASARSSAGTPRFMAPERAGPESGRSGQLEDDGPGATRDPRVDLYAVGALLYTALSGRRPYEELSADEVIVALRAGPPRPLYELAPRVAPSIAQVVGRAMSRDPEQRYPDATSMKAAIEHAEESERDRENLDAASRAPGARVEDPDDDVTDAPGWVPTASRRRWRSRANRARARLFVGRHEEIAVFQRWMGGDGAPLLHIHAAGGAGKTALLHAFRSEAEALGLRAVVLDGRDGASTPQAWAAVLSSLRGVDVLLLDNLGSLSALAGWLWSDAWPGLDDGTKVVTASRLRAPSAWRADAAFGGLVREHALAPLSSEDADEFLALRDVDHAARPTITTLAGGNALALGLATDVYLEHGIEADALRTSPNLVQALMKSLVDDAPTAAHREAVAASAILRTTTQPLIAAAVPGADADELFSWLAERPFVELGQFGLRPHDLVRSLVLTDMEWRDPELRMRISDRARSYVCEALASCPAEQQGPLIAELMHLTNAEPGAAPFEPSWSVAFSVDAARPEDVPELIALVAAAEGPEHEELARRWFGAHLDRCTVVRNVEGIAGFVQVLHRPELEGPIGAQDPGVQCLFAGLASAPLEAHDGLAYCRYFAARGEYYDATPIFTKLTQLLAEQLMAPGMSVGVSAHPELVLERFPIMGTHHVLGRFAMDERLYLVIGHDWRAEPVHEWVERMAQAMRAAPRFTPGEDSPPGALSDGRGGT